MIPKKTERKMRRLVPDVKPWRFRGQNRTQQHFDCARLLVGKQKVDIYIFIYLLQLGFYPVAVVILHVNKT